MLLLALERVIQMFLYQSQYIQPIPRLRKSDLHILILIDSIQTLFKNLILNQQKRQKNRVPNNCSLDQYFYKNIHPSYTSTNGTYKDLQSTTTYSPKSSLHYSPTAKSSSANSYNPSQSTYQTPIKSSKNNDK